MFEVFEHTADIGLVVRASSLEQLFAETANGMIWVMCKGLEREKHRSTGGTEITSEQVSGTGNPPATPGNGDRREITISATAPLDLPVPTTSPCATSLAGSEQIVLSPAWEDLLHDWLSKILYLFSAERVLPTAYDIRFDVDGLKARVNLRRYDPAKDGAELEIKAVTYHGLRIEREGDEFVARVIFDT